MARKVKGNPPSLTPGEKAAFKARVLAGPTGADGRCTLRTLAAEFGRPLQLYRLMHDAGLPHLRPRPRHRKNGPAALTAWLDRASFLSGT